MIFILVFAFGGRGGLDKRDSLTQIYWLEEFRIRKLFNISNLDLISYAELESGKISKRCRENVWLEKMKVPQYFHSISEKLKML